MPLPLGLYQHYKGALYEIMDLATHSETEELHVVYRPLYGDFKTWIRPLKMFVENITKEGREIPRFKYLGNQAHDEALVLFHTDYSRSTRIRLLLNLMGLDYTLQTVDLKHKSAEFLALAPFKSVPLLKHGDLCIYESGAISLYLADRFPAAQMAPPLNSPARAQYYQWLMVILAHLEPILLQVMEQKTSLQTLHDQLQIINQQQQSPYVLGEQCSALDALWWSELWWMQAVLELKLADYPQLEAYYKAHQPQFEPLLNI